ncbi:hypothetical protein HD554DRAFT_761658 [Boletus coccyginus]|nr:hypothetical protein HD554DRAFT_761658 [Boletus coccyginus]
MFAIGNATLAQGGSDENPIVLEGERADVFDLFLGYIHGQGSHSYSVDELQDLLTFAEKYRCPDTRTFVVDHIWGTRYDLHPAEIVGLETTFKMEKAFKWGFKRLLEMPIEDISKQHRLMMGGDVFVALVYTKSVIDKHCRIIAAEEPIILSHTDDCPNPKECLEDWHAVWWNGMGRFLLDGRNPQPYSDAVRRFKQLQFGRMGIGCRALMLKVIDDGLGFRYVETFIENVCQGLANDMQLDEASVY